MSAEQAVRFRMLSLLGADAELMDLVHGIFDGRPPRATSPHVSIGTAEGIDWGTKDCAGREVRLTVSLAGVGDSLKDRAAARVEGCAKAMRGSVDGWRIVGARILRTRFAFTREGGWRHDVVIRCRCLALEIP